MAFVRPDLTELRSRTRGEVASRLGLDALQDRSILRVLADVQAGLSHQLHGRLDFTALQLFVDTASGEYLDRHSGVWGVLRKPAGFAAGPVDLTGASGSTVPSGTAVKSEVTGREYVTLASATVAGGVVTVQVQATEPGSEGNLAAGTSLVMTQAVVGLDAAATVGTGGLVDGSSREDDDALRARILQRIQSPFQGGSADNYVTWALAEPGVTRAWALPNHMGLGTVGVTFVRDDDAGSIIPDTSEVALVQTAIDELRPVTAAVTVFAPGVESIDLSIALVPNNTAVQAAVTSSLQDLIDRETEPGGTILLTHLAEAISTAEGEVDHTLSAPVADVVAAAGSIHQLGTITWL